MSIKSPNTTFNCPIVEYWWPTSWISLRYWYLRTIFRCKKKIFWCRGNGNMGFMGHFEPNMGQNMGFMGNMGNICSVGSL